MNRSTRDILFIFIGLFLSLGTLWASKTPAESRLTRDVAYLNTLGRSSDGEKSLTLSLESRFRADSARINEMRRARLGYGDISVALSLASHLPGGITRANVRKIVALWKSPRFDGWGRIARSLGVRLERVVLQVESLRARPAGRTAAAAPKAMEMPRPSGSIHRLVSGE
ncbi:MAG: hypothetical protein ABSG21_00740 [Spirochaetia bacterium]|jgi:hypothetical protein